MDKYEYNKVSWSNKLSDLSAPVTWPNLFDQFLTLQELWQFAEPHIHTDSAMRYSIHNSSMLLWFNASTFWKLHFYLKIFITHDANSTYKFGARGRL
jgi:hypothetical protein